MLGVSMMYKNTHTIVKHEKTRLFLRQTTEFLMVEVIWNLGDLVGLNCLTSFLALAENAEKRLDIKNIFYLYIICDTN